MLKSSIILSLIVLSCFSCKNDAAVNKVTTTKLVRIDNFKSSYVPDRNVDVWLPESYSVDKKYDVLYMHDGQMLFDSTSTWNKQEWGVDETMSQLISQDIIKEAIVIGIWNTEYRHSEFFPQKPFESLAKHYQDSLINSGERSNNTALFKRPVYSDNYLKFIVKELKPHIDSNYATLPGPKNTYIAGSSMGGLISIYALCEYPEVFSGAACLSTHWIGTFEAERNPIPAAFADYLANNLPSPSTHKIYFDYGTETLDALYEPF